MHNIYLNKHFEFFEILNIYWQYLFKILEKCDF